MNIWFVNHYALPPSQTGGTRHFSLARELVKMGHQVVIFCSSFDHFARVERHLTEGEDWKVEGVDGVTFVWLKTPAYNDKAIARMWNMLMFARQFNRFALQVPVPRPDVILGSSPHLFAAFVAERLAKRMHVPFMLEVRDIWPQSLVDLSNIPSYHPVIVGLERLERYLYRRSDRLISLLPGAADYMVTKGAKRENVVWLPNGVDLSRAPAPQPLPENERFTLMFAGAHGLANGLDSVLDTAKLLQAEGWEDRIHIRLVGQGPEKERLKQRANREGIRLATFEDPVPKAQVYSLMSEADAFLMILKDSPVFRWGVSPNKLFDYMAMARPVIFGVNTPFNPVSDADAGLSVPPEDPAALAEAIKQLSRLPASEREAMGLRGAQYVRENHDFVRLAERLDAVLGELVGREPVMVHAEVG